MTTPDTASLANDIKAAIAELADGCEFPDLIAAVDTMAAELERLRAQVAAWETELSAVMPADFKTWHQGSKSEWPKLAADVIRDQRADRDLGWEMAARAAPAQQAEPSSAAPAKTSIATQTYEGNGPASAPAPAPAPQAPSLTVGDEPVKYPHPDEDDAVTLWAEIHRLRAAVQGPDGYATWQEAATAERVRRVKAEAALMDAYKAAAQAEPVAHISGVARYKVNSLIEQGYRVCGYTMEREGHRSAVLFDAAVRWLTDEQRHALMFVEGSVICNPPAQGVELPPLPEPDFSGDAVIEHGLYSADQMHAYARAAIAQAPATKEQP